MSDTISEAAGELVPAAADEPAGLPHGPSLSPSRAADFMTCPLLYRFQVLDRLG